MSLIFHDGDMNKLVRDTTHDSIVFKIGEQEIVSLKSNGDIFVKGNLIENDKEVVDGLREFLRLSR
ncbi:hypothetical protein P4278_10145 [Bacillus thuringiensis]|nr:hypothetical protein [Bacillus thuringiensis]MED2760310.1 hypothetical protein [Bacillus thuringiensis]MED2768494.1 hypothetical protein [Bacillus thuringiensis]MED2777977.1 hypothetical protein [Bacillus thuringiensis]MED2780060.1 hypothetical protein [Bacillus thuringiensis]